MAVVQERTPVEGGERDRHVRGGAGQADHEVVLVDLPHLAFDGRRVVPTELRPRLRLPHDELVVHEADFDALSEPLESAEVVLWFAGFAPLGERAGQVGLGQGTEQLSTQLFEQVARVPSVGEQHDGEALLGEDAQEG